MIWVDASSRLRSAVVAVGCALVVALAFGSAPARAERIYYPGVSFGGPCVVKTGEPCEGKFDEPTGVAVNDANPLLEPVAGGDVYVVDKGNNRVERFGASGVYLGQFNGSGTYEVEGKEVKHGAAAPSGAFQEPERIAVDNCTNQMLGTICTTAEDSSVGDVYVTDKGHKVVDKFSATGEYLGQLTDAQNCEQRELPPCSGSKTIVVPFTNVSNVAVDPSGDVWVYGGENEEYAGAYVQEFSVTGAALQWFRTRSRLGRAFAASSHETVYASESAVRGDEVAIYEKKSPQEPHNDGFNEERRFGGGVNSLAIAPPTSSFFAGDALADMGNAIAVYAPIVEHEQQSLETFPGETVPKGYEGLSGSDGLAVNASATVYASESEADKVESFNYSPVPKVITEPPSGVSETALRLHGSVNPEGEEIKECYFEYGTEAGNYTGGMVACKQTPGAVNESVPVEAELSELAPAQARSLRLVAVNKAGIAKDGGGVTIKRPLITQEAVSDVGSTAATLNAEVDPAGYETCYRIEYGATTAYGGSVEGECVGAGDEAVALSREVSGLEPNVVYHFRVVARNALGANAGEDVVARTFPAGEGELPDGRVYELVSTPPSAEGSNDGNVYVPTGGQLLSEGEGLDPYNGTSPHGISSPHPAQAAGDGEAVTYAGDPPASGGGGNEGNEHGNQYIATRAPNGGWTQASLSPSGAHNEYLAFSGELSTGVLRSSEELTSDAPQGYEALYARTAGGGPFEALFTAAPERRTPQEFGYVDGHDQLETSLLAGGTGLTLAGGNAGTGAVPAFSHLVFEASAVLPSTPAAPEGGVGENNLYDSVGGRLYLVNVLPEGKVQAGATLGRYEAHSESDAEGRYSTNAVSADGSRIVWSSPEWVSEPDGSGERAGALYVRENDTQPQSPVEEGRCTVPTDACTVQVDLKQPGSSGQNGGGQFVAASGDGSRVLFTDENRLTGDSVAKPGSPDLYEYDLEGPEEERLTDLSVPAGAGAGANVQGVVGSSVDGSYVYFVADGVLSEGKNAEGVEPAEGHPNLYLYHDAHNTFIATLGPADGNFTLSGGSSAVALGDWRDPGHRTAEVSSDGRAVTFMSTLPLTHYDNAFEGVPVTEVFVYEAETGRIACASCNPSGEPPVASAGEFHREGGVVIAWGSLLPTSGSLDAYQSRVISEGGSRVFFDSIEPLVPRDSNGYLDVYEWERDGSGSCTLPQGCVYLLSGGQNPENSYLLDASESGDDVFFVSRAQLASKDRGSDAEALYDARVGGVTAHPESIMQRYELPGRAARPADFRDPRERLDRRRRS